MKNTPSTAQVDNDCRSIVSLASRITRTYPEAHSIVYSPRRTGDTKVTGGYTPDATGERASCECERAPMIDPDSGQIVLDAAGDPVPDPAKPIRHVCAPPTLRYSLARIMGCCCCTNECDCGCILECPWHREEA